MESGSFELILPHFSVLSLKFEVVVSWENGSQEKRHVIAIAKIKVQEREFHAVAEGTCEQYAFGKLLEKVLIPLWPEIHHFHYSYNESLRSVACAAEEKFARYAK